MDFVNSTNFPAEICSGSTSDAEMLCLLAGKVTYLREEAGLTPVPPDQSWPVFVKPFVFADVVLGSDLEFRQRGIDILVFGQARAPPGKSVAELPISIECGHVRWEARVFGDRRWERAPQGLRPSKPLDFVEMPLTNDRVYGGRSKLDGVEMAHRINPHGRGFHLTEEQAEGQLLPNIESPIALISRWDDVPVPACLYKPAGLLRKLSEEGGDPDTTVCEMMDGLFNDTVPQLVAKPEDLGSELRLVGFSAERELVFPLPPLNGPRAVARVGGQQSEFPSTLSSLVVLADPRVMIATYFCAFRYLFRPQQRRDVDWRWDQAARVDRVALGEVAHV